MWLNTKQRSFRKMRGVVILWTKRKSNSQMMTMKACWRTCKKYSSRRTSIAMVFWLSSVKPTQASSTTELCSACSPSHSSLHSFTSCSSTDSKTLRQRYLWVILRWTYRGWFVAWPFTYNRCLRSVQPSPRWVSARKTLLLLRYSCSSTPWCSAASSSLVAWCAF